MTKKKKRPLAPPPLKSLKRARKVTSEFHAATRDLEAALSSGDAGAARDARERVERLGGRERYQEASVAATGRHRTTSKFVWSHLTRLGYRDRKGGERGGEESDGCGDESDGCGDEGEGEKKKNKKKRKRRRGGDKPKLLEIGAVNTQLLSTPWLDVRSIDLRAPAASSASASGRKKRIEEVDFFDVGKLPRRNEYDAVVCSMVLNCVPSPEKRGEMLRGIRGHLKDGRSGRGGRGGGGAKDGDDGGDNGSGNDSGLAFIMLPRRCVEASRACDWERFERKCLARAGLGEILARRASEKVAFWVARATEVPESDGETEGDEALIARAHAAGEFAVSMRRRRGGEKKDKRV